MTAIVSPPQPDAMAASVAGADGGTFARIRDVSVTFTMRLGRTTLTLQDVMEIGDQSLIELDRSVGDPVDVLVNGRLFAEGEVVTVGEYFGVKVTRIAVGTSLQIQSLAVGTDGEGRRQVVVQGTGSEQQNVAEAIARGVAAGVR